MTVPATEPQLKIEPEIGIPYEPGAAFIDLHERAVAACATAKELEEFGLDLTETLEAREAASILATAYAEDPEKASKAVTDHRASNMTPASLVLTGTILDEFGQTVVKNSVHIRHLVTNKLIIETENPDARVRLRALELLGKVSDVGLFTEKKEVTINHTSSEELRARLKNKLSALVPDAANAADAEYEVVEEG